MKVLLDTNIIIDILEKRQEFCEDSVRVFSRVADYQGFIAASSITDIYYIEHKRNHNKKKTLKIIKKLLGILDILDTTSADCRNALRSGIPDFEDAIIVESAIREDIDYIVTRNVKDFKNSPVKACTPVDFLGILSSKASNKTSGKRR